ncbi:RipA family octameric membrane protein [Pseudomonas oryzihabitans]|uniref:RipA family octameric membrane protein n=1 Tax=Pseudomonas oryzihabitans TaxID=47885 RepID=UPI0030BFEA35
MTQGPHDEALEAAKRVYEQCIEIRNFEISQLASRNNFLMIFQGVLFAGLVQSAGAFPIISFMACLTGFLVSWYQMQIAAGAKYWQEHWEHELKAAEERLLDLLNIGPRVPVKLFSKGAKEIRENVSARLTEANCNLLIKLLILNKYSVSRVPIKLGIALMAVWFVLLLCTLNLSFFWSFPDLILGFRK